MERRDVAAAAAHLTGIPVDQITVQDVPYAWGSPATGGLWTVALPAGAREPSEYFVKLLRHVRLWPALGNVPEPFRDRFVAEFPWRFEYDLHEAGVPALLPPGMRTPTLHHVDTPDPDHVLLWWERIHDRTTAWSLDEYARAAFLLGRFAARRRAGAAVNEALPPICHRPPNWALRYLVESRVLMGAVPELRGSALWEHPAVAAAVDRLEEHRLQSDLLSFAASVPSLLDLLDSLPLTYAHGDASPQNILIDERDPQNFVVIDWGLGTLLPVGFDLGQLLIGPVHAGLVDPDDIPAIDEVILQPYVDGLSEDGFALPPAVVRTGYHVSLALRSALTTLSVIELTKLPAELVPTFVDQRIRLTRRLLELTADSVLVG
jgi:hypothetical protein